MNARLLSVLFCTSLMLLLTTGASISAQSPVPPEITELATGNNAFAFDLYHTIAAENEGNLFYSPLSISQALAMTYAGARGTTESEMAQTLHFTLSQAALHPAFAALNANFEERAQTELVPDDEAQRFQLTIANALWGQADFPFLPDFVQLLDKSYGAGLQLTDFVQAPEAARDDINQWVEDQTEDKIQDIVPEGAITPDTRLVLANAIYFHAGWQRTFSETATEDAPFTLLDGAQVTVPTMRQQEGFLYQAGEGYQAVMLPYYGGQMGMMIVLPDEGAFEQVETSLTGDSFSAIVAAMSYQELWLFMPKFEFEFGLELADTLAAMGMPEAFTDAADFSGMAEEPLFISRILHKAFVGVDENGTEAAAATIVMMEATSAMPSEPLELRLDRPFIFTIYDNVTGTILFVGRVMNPAQ